LKPDLVLIRAILALEYEPPLFTGYDRVVGGLMTLDSAPDFNPIRNTARTFPIIPPMPAPAPAPTVEEMNDLAAHLGKLSIKIADGSAFYLADDWQTQGDWIGRYGNGYVKLCGIGGDGSDHDYKLQAGFEVKVQAALYQEPPGEANPMVDDDAGDDLRTLYDPVSGHRRGGVDVDIGWGTGRYFDVNDGPDLWVSVQVPEGIHRLSLYFVNSSHDKFDNVGSAFLDSCTKYRDYDLQLFPGENKDGRIDINSPLARARVTDFWGGVYKQFLLGGPGSYVLRINRNRSFETRLQAVFLDRVAGPLPDITGKLPGFSAIPYQPPAKPNPGNSKPTPLTKAAVNLWSQLDDALGLRGAVALQMPFRIWCYRAAIAGHAPPDILERWRWQISIWTAEDRKKFDDTMKAAHDAAK
jgi:hypothetical protein